ncbi:TrbC/VirB2 family protein [Paraglaciecola sp. 20A4]|uniref:TrbC/VirB2 family protein n=1 Tax=Paraglaciecola sp. 20A4 TaxID=2687288 RepID=UPI0014081651|nr:TrbC/VirB2 family protein [Paraglaciecola sp. 20A4]
MKSLNTMLSAILTNTNTAKSKVLAFKERQLQRFTALCAFLLTSIMFSSSAYADYDIGGPSSGPWAALTEFAQDVINLIDGPVALTFSFISLVGMAITWAIAPKMMNAMGTFARVMIAVVVILNIGVWITALQS